MTWHAKPSGGYSLSSSENYDNSMEIYGILYAQGFTVEAIAGVCANAQAESGLNPWRWQSDTVGSNYGNGYGLLQWTPGRGYIYLPGTTPNLSTSSVTSGATPEDGARQIRAFYENNPAKWVSSCWRSYWSSSAYPEYYARTRYIVNTWGNGSSISLDQFKNINDCFYASDCFLACFEGPGVPNYEARHSNASAFYNRFTGVDPPEPPEPPEPPGPPEPPTDIELWWLFKKFSNIANIHSI